MAILPLLALAALAAAASSTPEVARRRAVIIDKPGPKKKPRLEVVHAPDDAKRIADNAKKLLLGKGGKALVNAAKKHVDVLKKAVEQGAPQVVSMTPALAAQALRSYLLKTGDFGTSAQRSANVAKLQKLMGMGADSIGIVGPKTHARGLVLGVVLPVRPAAAAANKAQLAKKLPAATVPVSTDSSALPVAPSQKKPFTYTDETARQVATRRGVDAPTKSDKQIRAQRELDAQALQKKQLDQDAALAARSERDGDLAAAARGAVAAIVEYRKTTGKPGALPLLPIRKFQLADGVLTNDGEWGPNVRTAAAYYLGVSVDSLPKVPPKYAGYAVTWKPHTTERRACTVKKSSVGRGHVRLQRATCATCLRRQSRA